MQTVLDGIYVLTRKDMSTHRAIPFTVPAGAHRMRISVSYDPKYNFDEEYGLALIEKSMKEQIGELLPIDNHLSFSLDSPLGAVGTAHRGNNSQEFEISETDANGGFYPTPITAGEWTFTVSVTCIVTDEIKVSLRIEVGE